MANEIDLWRDLERAEKMINTAKKNDDFLMLKAWKKERKNIILEIKTNYPDLCF